MSKHAYGWNAQRADHRDHDFALEERIYEAHKLPLKVDLWPHVPPIWDQGQLGSCTAHGSLRAWCTEAIRQGVSLPAPPPGGAPLSRLMEYWDTRAVELSTATDSGGQVRDAIKVLASKGCAPESDWPYDIARFADEPPATCYADARQYMSVRYQAVRVSGRGAPMRTALASGLSIVFGFPVPESFEDGSWDPASVPLPLPDPSEGYVGGHCVTVTGYDFSRREHPDPYFICDNSWAASWGGAWGGAGCSGGRFAMDYRWFTPLLGLASDLWVIQQVR